MKLIGLTGHAGNGKDTVAEMIEGRRFSFAEPLKLFCKATFDFTDEQVFGPSECRNRPDPRYTREDGAPLTPRHALQTLGTEWGRACYPDVWADLGVRRATQWLSEESDTVSVIKGKLVFSKCKPVRVAILTDCRFINEAKAIRAAGGEVWRIIRPGHVLPPEIANHPSETEQDSPEMDALVTEEVVNGGTLADLKATVDEYIARFVQARR